MIPEDEVLAAFTTLTRLTGTGVLRRLMKRLAGDCMRRVMEENQDWHDRLYELEDLHADLTVALTATEATLRAHKEARPPYA